MFLLRPFQSVDEQDQLALLCSTAKFCTAITTSAAYFELKTLVLYDDLQIGRPGFQQRGCQVDLQATISCSSAGYREDRAVLIFDRSNRSSTGARSKRPAIINGCCISAHQTPTNRDNNRPCTYK